MPELVGVASAFPAQYYRQRELLHVLTESTRDRGAHGFEPAQLARFFSSVQVSGRHLAQPAEWYVANPSFAERNAAWLRVATELGERAIRGLLTRANLEAAGVDMIAFTTVTGIAVPSVDARLMNRLEFGPHTRRLPLFGLGCVAGAAGVARLADYLKGSPSSAALLLSVELCSLTLQQDDFSISNMIASALFGDGAAAALLVGDHHPLARTGRARIVDTRSIFFADTERAMGWDVVDGGFKIVLGPGVPKLARHALPGRIQDFLAAHDLTTRDIGYWIAHPGGPAVMEGLETGLGLDELALAGSRACLSRIGNLSSASVLIVLEDLLKERRPPAGSWGLMLAMGPGFCAELILLQW